MKTLIISPNPKRTKKGNYFEALIKAAQSLGTSGVSVATIRHDEWCKLLARSGPCNCNPDLDLQALTPKRDGHK